MFFPTTGTGLQWCVYGFFAYCYTGNHGFLIVVYANIFGAILGTFYTLTFQRYCGEPGSDLSQWAAMKIYYLFVAGVFGFQGLAFWLRPEEQSLLLAG